MGTAAVISGTTRWYAVLGDPVTQVRAPELLNPVLAGFDAVLVPLHVRPDDLAGTLAGLARVRNLDGLLVTVPHKAAVCRLAAAAGPAAALAGTANALRRRPSGGWFAENFDGLGFVRGLTAAGHAVSGRRFGLAGAGGAGSAIAVALLDAGAAGVAVSDVDAGRRDALVARLEGVAPGRIHAVSPAAVTDADVVVNATPLGMRPDDRLPFDPAAAAPGTLVVEIIMKPRETELLRKAAESGLAVHHGSHMLDQQVGCYRDFFGWPR